MSSSQSDTRDSRGPHSVHAKLRKAIQDERNDEAIATMNSILSEGRTEDESLCRWLRYSIGCNNIAMTEHLLGMGVHPDGGSSPNHLLFALKKDKFGIAQILLKTSVDVNAIDQAGRTALMIAACKDQIQIVNTLIGMGADPNKRNNDGGNVLHYLSADRGCKWGRNIFEVLLKTNVEIDARDERGRTPLHWAVATGKTSLCERLLSLPKERRANIKASDLRRKTCLHFAASGGHNDVINVLLDHGADVNASADGSWKPIHLACDTGHKSTAQKLILAGAKLNAKLLTGMTPLHVAARAGHLEVIEFLLQQEHSEPLAKDSFGYTPFDYALRTKKEDIIAILGNVYNHLDGDALGACQGYNATVTDFGNYYRGNKVRRLSVFELLYQLDDAIPNGYRTKIYPNDIANVSFRWIHLPANNCSWVDQTLRRALLEEGNQDSSSFVAAARSLDHYFDGQYTHSRFMRSLYQEMELRPALSMEPDAPSNRIDESVATTNISMAGSGVQNPSASTGMSFLYMPYLHYESAKRCQEMQDAIQRVEHFSKSTRPVRTISSYRSATCDDMLLHAYNPQKAIFVRRTLNQFLHPNLGTTTRESEQVAYSYQEKLRTEAYKVDHKIFMVDQLWMWVIGEKLVITAFPQRWQQPRNDPLNVLESVVEDINARTRSAPVRTAFDLAAAITQQCSTVFRSRSGFQEYQLLDVFDQCISDAVEMESLLFKEFNTASAEASAWLQHNRSDTNKRMDMEQKVRPVLFVDQLLEIGAEVDLMAELRYIRKELGIIVSVFEEQRNVLQSFESAIRKSFEKGHRQGNVLQEQVRVVDQYIRDLQRTDTKAERSYKSITDLLDLKQKHANALGVRFARDQAAELAGQRPTLVFTIVTIVFLPLSFVATLFTVNIRELPHQPGDSEPSLPLSFVLKYLIGIGFGISIPLIVVVLSFNSIKDIVRQFKRRLKD